MVDIRAITLVVAFVATLGVSTASEGMKDSITAGNRTDIYEMEASYFLNHLDSFVITTYYSSLIKASENVLSDSIVPYELPEGRDSIYRVGLEQLNENTPFDLQYNDYVRAFIDLYIYKKRELTENCLGLSEYYFPIFEEALDKYDLPIEFKYLAIVESALNVRARSRAGAAGLWQFMYRTGKHYDLNIDSYIDERYEIYAATDAACRFFVDLYKTYDNWELVIAAYNCGPGNVNKAIRRSGGKRTYWEIRKWLPRETRGYVPAFIAVNYAMNYSELHEMSMRYPDSLDLLTDTIMLADFNFHSASKYFCTDIEKLLYLNPSYKRGELPDNGKKYPVRMPIGLMNAFIEQEEHYNNYLENAPKAEQVVAVKTPTYSGERHVHVVKSGEVLGVIAEEYGCGVSQIKNWNNLYSSRIYEGQKLVIYSKKKIASQPKAVPVKKVIEPDNPNYRYHVIRSGDTLWDIANMYDGLTVTELRRLNEGLNHRKLKPGDKIIVAKKG